jgi:hypothetical protein
MCSLQPAAANEAHQPTEVGCEGSLASMFLRPTCLPGRPKGALHFGNALLIALVEGPLLDPLRSQEPRMGQDPEVLASRRLAHAELLGNEQPAHAVPYQIAVDLGPKIGSGVFQP